MKFQPRETSTIVRVRLLRLCEQPNTSMFVILFEAQSSEHKNLII